MDKRVYNAQMFNILSLMWAETCKNIIQNENISNPYDRRFVISLIDEAHQFISADKNIQVTEYIEKLTRKTRKYDAALWFASQSVSDFNPNGNDSGSRLVKTIFSLVQYKLILKQLPESLEALKEAFPSVPDSELAATKDFQAGEMLVSLGSDRSKLHCLRSISDIELFYIGNSRDRQECVNELFTSFYGSGDEDYGEFFYSNKDNLDAFKAEFAEKALNYFGYTRTDSEYLYSLVVRSIASLVNRYCEDYLKKSEVR